MTERLLQYIWQFQHFNKSELITTQEEPLQILHPGTYNTSQGPDFTSARIKVGTTIWAGSIELHILSSDWKAHKHTSDKNYKNVMLHVVWQNDVELSLPFPTLVLEDRVSKLLLAKYDELMNTGGFIACEKNIGQVNSLILASWKERLLAERLEKKSAIVFSYLQLNNFHWEETFWWMLAKNFGIKVNAGAFEKIARSIPIAVLAKHKNQIHQLEALLLGQAGLLEGDFKEDYPKLLQREYRFYKGKLRLKPIHEPLFFLRMRPANFPTLRLAQLAMLIHASLHLFSKIKESAVLKDVKLLLNVTANDYWHYHYTLEEITAFKKKNIGKQMVENICINTIMPVLFAYGMNNNENQYKERAIRWLAEIKAEKNAITKGFTSLAIKNNHAYDSQALIQLKNEYCDKKRCLECAIGNSLLRKPL